jgi:hypothetical protein
VKRKWISFIWDSDILKPVTRIERLTEDHSQKSQDDNSGEARNVHPRALKEIRQHEQDY